jgi:hypothetical protein
MAKISVSGLLIAVIICAMGLGVSAWGPASRETFTTDNLPNHVAFNSITNNPGWGDERGFMQIKESDEPDSEYRSGITLEPGKTYIVRAYYHNNASASSNGLSFQGPGVARGAYARVVFPGFVDGSEFASFILGADNAQHFDAAGNDLGREVFGNITLRTEQALNIIYVEDSAKLHNSTAPAEGRVARTFDLTADLFGAWGTPIGFDEMNGIMPGGSGHDGVITFMITTVPRDSEVAIAIDNAVRAAIFAAILALLTICFVTPVDKLWKSVLEEKSVESKNAVTEKTETVKKKTVAKIPKIKKGMNHKLKILLLGVILFLAMIAAVLFSAFSSKKLHEWFFMDTVSIIRSDE